MPFEPGQSGNPLGRKIGTKNKINESLRISISNFLEKKFPDIENDFNSLKPFARVKLYLELLQFGVPKLKEVNIENEFERMTDTEIDTIIKRLTVKANEKV